MNTKKSPMDINFYYLSSFTFFVSGVVVNAETYEVKYGDTLSEIAIKNNTTIEKLVELNQISNQDLIHAGQIIELGERSKSLINKVNTATVSQGTSSRSFYKSSSGRNNNYCHL